MPTKRRGLLGSGGLQLFQYLAAWIACYALGVTVLQVLKVSVLWPSGGVLTCALLSLRGRSRWTFLGVVAATSVTVSLVVAHAPKGALLSNAAGWVEALITATLIQRVCQRNYDFSDLRRLSGLVLLAIAPACLVGVLIRDSAGALLQLPQISDVLWFASHGLGQLIVIAPYGVALNRRRYRSVGGSPLELKLLLVVCATYATFAANVLPNAAMALTIPLMLFVAFRHGPVGAAFSNLIIGFIAILATCLGMHRHVILGDAIHDAIFSACFTTLILVTNLAVASTVATAARMRNVMVKRAEIARTARRRADIALSARGEFLANMSHEIRTPLNGVIGVADVLSRTELNQDQRDMVKMILGSGRALTGLLSDLLDLAKADSGALELNVEAFGVRDAVGGACYLFRSIAETKGIALKTEFDTPSCDVVMGDALRLKQIISNLISNAVKFTSDGEVSVDLRLVPIDCANTTLTVKVTDTGQGFDEAVGARLFNRFEQGDGSITRRFGGSGLGLSIAKRLTDMMGGHLSCTSTVGVGSTFMLEVSLPVGRDVASTAQAGSGTLHPERSDLRVLLAEDHPVNRYVVQTMLAGAVALTSVTNGKEAIEAMGLAVFDLVLMDTHMPEVDGLTAIRALRQLERQAGRPRAAVISLTADAMAPQVAAARAAGADLHLAKPFTADQLFAAMESVLSAPEAAAKQLAG